MYAEFFSILQNLTGDCCRNVPYFYTMKMDTGTFTYKFICLKTVVITLLDFFLVCMWSFLQK